MTKKEKYNKIIEQIVSEGHHNIEFSSLEKGKINLVLSHSHDVVVKDKPMNEFIDDRIRYAKKVLKFLEGLKK